MSPEFNYPPCVVDNLTPRKTKNQGADRHLNIASGGVASEAAGKASSELNKTGVSGGSTLAHGAIHPVAVVASPRSGFVVPPATTGLVAV